MERVRQVGVVLYDKVDTLDFAGPHDVFGVAGYLGKNFRVFTVAEKKTPLTTVSGITITPQYSFDTCPTIDILIVPGGLGSRTEITNSRLIAWIRETAGNAEIVLSVCTGALLLAKAGLLEGLRVTTNRMAYDLLRGMVSPGTTIVEDVRYVDNGKMVMSGGVTTGFDAALHVVARLCGESLAMETASRLEYRWHDKLDIRRAELEDTEAVRGLLVGAAQWIQRTQGLVQWREERFTHAYVSDVIDRYELFVANMNGVPVGCLSVQWGYEEIWGDQFHENAGYVHRLAVSRDCQSMGIGTRLLNWAESYVKDQGKTWLRLDCMADNAALNGYYARQGFAFCGRYEGQGWSAHLYERRVAGNSDAK
ncbi:GNAT family N-acetyltransferase [Paenibacillus planticolens]|uniref:GNAT family N-acetyltransferase n=1 Tax=Paenibacillus planticolens TaxID=2654976 RepID=A0ABX1ZMQ2_9BACL|nr:GNAT family N-acetyltransferase [Paenibacillus planticolens]NOV00034.1 GNAT family N-acetyltransferase [Paenibacillus planticolens]